MKNASFGFGQIFNSPPKWVVALLAILLLASQVAKFIVAGDMAIVATTQVRILLYLSGLDMFLLGVSALFGVKPKEEE